MSAPSPKPSLNARTILALTGTAIAVLAWSGIGWILWQEANREGGIARLFNAQPGQGAER